ncbi:GMP reductase [Frankliniella fusca]|uniref:GMP reductase n=1 Tax=Frankliniella fusca TaxID=407009 RepID=A0AAE1GY44_9NEOP|nr:GMP reductase [Frankliniella fusca]
MFGGVQQEEEFEQHPGDEVPNGEDEELLNDGEGASSSSSESSASDSDDDESEDNESEDGSGEEAEELDGEPNVGVADGDVPLYPNSRISLAESLIMILTLSLRFSLSGECVELESKDSVCERCGDNTKSAFFIEIQLIHQLQKLFLRPGFVEQLMYRFNRVKKHAVNYEDIYDGNVYKEQIENGFLSHVHNISLMWYTDGIQIFKSSKFGVRPLFFSINELSYKARTLKENTLLCGLWFGKLKPKPNLFLKPFRQTFQTFKTDGFRFHVPEGDQITVKGKLLCGTCDLPAKSLFMRSKQFNAYYGCAKCYSKGERAPAGRTTVHVHPFTPPVEVRLRQNNEVIQCARIARRTEKSNILGIKGLSILYFLMPDMIRGTGIDIMHQLFLGVCKALTKFWFDSFSGELFSCSAMTDIINERLSSIRSPSFVQRMTRSLAELKLWKAKEYKLFFFLYAIPALNAVKF